MTTNRTKRTEISETDWFRERDLWFLLLESGWFLLLESGWKIILEQEQEINTEWTPRADIL